jgi:plastocyanin
LVGVLATCAWGDGAGPGSPSLTVAKAPASGDGQTGTISTQLVNPLQVEVIAAGAPVAGVTVIWQTADAGGSVLPGSSVTDANGSATTMWTLGSTAGTQTATASVADAQGSPVQFTASAVSGPVPLVSMTATNSGDGQTGVAGDTLANPLRIIVTLNGVAQNGVTVAWTAADAGASMAPGSSLTNASGIATSSWILGGVTGTQRATASVSGGAGSPVSFSATATAPPAGDTVMVVNNQFTPKTLTVSAGSTVIWVWPATSRRHNIVPVSPAVVPNSPTIVDGPYTYTFTFTTPGTYNYYCTVHGTASGGGMFGTLVVQ